MDTLRTKYEELCNITSDINEHLPTLKRYAENCDSVLETGVRGCISSWALSYGLLCGEQTNKKHIFLNDIEPCDIAYLQNTLCNIPNIQVDYMWCNNLQLNLDKTFDLVFIDTWHVYGQLKRELEKFSKITNKWIIMHDTTIDEIYGESIRNNSNMIEQSQQTGIPVEEISMGLKYAISEFLLSNIEWVLHERFSNNNGLTILRRVLRRVIC